MAIGIRPRWMLTVVVVALALVAVGTALAQTALPPCQLDDGTPATCVRAYLMPATLVGDFYFDGTLDETLGRVGDVMTYGDTPGATETQEFRNIGDPSDPLFNVLYIYNDVSRRVTFPALGQWREYALTPTRRYIRGTLELTCSIRSHAGENVACGVIIDGIAQAETIAAGQRGTYILDPGAHSVVVALTGDPAQTLLWSPASRTLTVNITAGAYPRWVTATFNKAGHLIASIQQSDVIGDWYVDNVLVATQVASIDTWVTPSVSHRLEVRNATLAAQPLIHPYRDATVTTAISSGLTRTVTVRLRAVMPGGVVIIPHPNCPAPTVTTSDYVVIRVRKSAVTRNLAEQNADHVTVQILLDGQDLGDIRQFRQSAQTYPYGCGWDQVPWIVHWDVPVGRLAAGTHTITAILSTDVEISDGFGTYPPGVFSSHSIEFTVTP